MGYVMAATTIVLWGLVHICLKLAKAPGRVGVVVSVPVAAATMLLILAVQGGVSLPVAGGRDCLFIALTGVCNFSLAGFAYFEAVKRAGITTAAPITRLTAILVVMASAAFGVTELSWALVFAALLVFLGGVLLAGGAHLAHPVESRRDLRVGMLYAFFSCVMWAGGILAVDQVAGSIRRSKAQVFALAVGVLVNWGIMALAGRLKELHAMTRRDVLLYCSHGVVSFAVGYWAFFRSIELLGVGKASVITRCWPAAAVITGIVVFRERMNLYKLFGVVLLIGSAVLAGTAEWVERFLLTLWNGW